MPSEHVYSGVRGAGGDVSPLVLGAAEASGVSPPLTEHEILVLLVQLVLLIGTARILGGLFKRIGQPAVVGELLAGVLLGPTLFGRIAPEAYDWVFGDDVVQAVVFGLAWLGVILLLVVRYHAVAIRYGCHARSGGEISIV